MLIIQNPLKNAGVQRKYSDADFEVRVNELVKKSKYNPEWDESVIIALAKKLIERARLPSPIFNIFNLQ